MHAKNARPHETYHLANISPLCGEQRRNRGLTTTTNVNQRRSSMRLCLALLSWCFVPLLLLCAVQGDLIGGAAFQAKGERSSFYITHPQLQLISSPFHPPKQQSSLFTIEELSSMDTPAIEQWMGRSRRPHRRRRQPRRGAHGRGKTA